MRHIAMRRGALPYVLPYVLLVLRYVLPCALLAAPVAVHAQATASSTFQPGTRVTVQWPGADVRYPGTVDRVDGRRIFVKFSGAVSPPDQWVDPARVKVEGGEPARPAPARASWRVGETVEVESRGRWYTATVLAVGSGTAKVRYAGYDSSWDEWVGPARMRRAAQPTAAARRAAASPVGRYQCTTYDAGQLNIVGDFTLAANGAYRDAFNGGSGRYTHDAATGRIRFTSGPQRTDAMVRFQPEGAHGRARIEFTYPSGSVLHCQR